MAGENKEFYPRIPIDGQTKDWPKKPDYEIMYVHDQLDDQRKAIREMKADTDEKTKYRGGSYGELKEDGYGWPDYEVHHIPADSASEFPRDDGPAIVMDYEDHRLTASCGMSKKAIEYRETQKELIAQGKYMEAVRMDIDDLHEKFGDKYDGAIAEMLPYAEKVAEKFKEADNVQV